jgi:fructose-1,6-bisphosphatase/inositol monophosphatase family enzyme
MPLLDDMSYTAGPNEVISLGRPLQNALRQNWKMKGFLASASFVHQNFEIDMPRIRALGSVNANLIYTTRGAAAAAFAPRPHLWDLVAGGAILLNRGGALRYLSGKSIDYLSLLDGRKTPEPVIAGHPTVLDELPKLIHPKRKNETRNRRS